MPIIRTYQCPECFHRIEVVLSAEQWDDPPPSCPACDAREMGQEFKPIAIGGSHSARAHAIAADIISNDYKVADFQAFGKEGLPAKVRYKDDTGNVQTGKWTGPNARELQMSQEAIQTAIALGRDTRQKYGNGLDILKHTLASGDQPDLIEVSKRRSAKVW
jgi:putative FmdB family regulatory protein